MHTQDDELQGGDAPRSAQAPPPGRLLRTGRWLDERFRSASAIYGLIVYTAFVTISADGIDDAGHELDASEILWDALPALLVFYAAHVFAHTLTDHGRKDLTSAFQHAAVHSSGMLYSAAPSVLILAIGSVTHMTGEDAYMLAMLAAVVMLAVLGYVAFHQRGAHVAIRLLGAVVTAALGLTLILAETGLH